MYIIIIVSIILPITMLLLQKKWEVSRLIINAGALISALVFFNIAAHAIYQILMDNTVFMTNIHALFLKPLFLITGAYLGIYSLYSLALFLTADLLKTK